MAKSKKSVRKTTKKSTRQPAKKIKIVTETKTRAVTIAMPAAEPVGTPANTTLDTLYIVNASSNDVTLEVNAGAAAQTFPGRHLSQLELIEILRRLFRAVFEHPASELTLGIRQRSILLGAQ